MAKTKSKKPAKLSDYWLSVRVLGDEPDRPMNHMERVKQARKLHAALRWGR